MGLPTEELGRALRRERDRTAELYARILAKKKENNLDTELGRNRKMCDNLTYCNKCRKYTGHKYWIKPGNL